MIEKRTLRRAVVVEGKYDAAKLAALVDATILTTDGAAIFSDRAQQRLLKRLAEKQGLLLLTDSDAAGFEIRHFITKIVGEQYVLQAYVPALPGKEARKAAPGKEGLLGVEGVPAETILRAIDLALAGEEQVQTDQPARPGRKILYSDLFEWGLSGGAGSSARRRAFLEQLGLPPRLSKKAMLEVLNTLYTYDALDALLKETGGAAPN